MAFCFYTAQGQYVCNAPPAVPHTPSSVEGFYAPTNDTQITKFGHGMVAAMKTACKNKTAADSTCQATIKNQFNSYMNCNAKSMARCDMISEAELRLAAKDRRRRASIETRQCPPSWNQTARTAYYDDTLKAFNKNILENTTHAPIFADVDKANPNKFASYERAITGHAKANTLLPAYKQAIATLDLPNMCDKPF